MDRHCAPSWLCEGFKSKGLSPRDSNTVPGTPGEARVDGLLLATGSSSESGSNRIPGGSGQCQEWTGDVAGQWFSFWGLLALM